jgi:hypothetical protein
MFNFIQILGVTRLMALPIEPLSQGDPASRKGYSMFASFGAAAAMLMLTATMAAAETNVRLFQPQTNCQNAGSGNIPPRGGIR